MDDSRNFSDAAREIYRREGLRAAADRRRGSLSIRTPKVDCERRRMKWFGAPPTPLEKIERPTGNVVSF